MKRVRIAVCLLFVISCAVFGMYMVKIRMVEDNEPPVITCEEDKISVSVGAEQSELMKGLKATDNRDGDITNSIRVSSMSHFIEKGKRTVTYVVFDKANLAATIERTVEYTDYVSPKIYASKPFRYELKDMSTDKVMGNLTAEDSLEGDVTNKIYTSWKEDTYTFKPGIYSVILQVNNEAGDVCAVPVEVTVLDDADESESKKNYPILKDYILYTSVGKELGLASNITGITSGNGELSFTDDAGILKVSQKDIQVKPQVDYSKPGTYPVEYVYTNSNGITAVTKAFVVVEE